LSNTIKVLKRILRIEHKTEHVLPLLPVIVLYARMEVLALVKAFLHVRKVSVSIYLPWKNKNIVRIVNRE